MPNQLFSCLFIVFVTTHSCAAQQRSIHDCILMLRLPSATDGLPRKWFSSDTETVRIRISFEKYGSLRDIYLEGGTEPLRQLTNEWLRKSRFLPSCSGSAVSFEYEYKLYRRPAAMHLPSVTLKAGDIFLLEFLEALPPTPFIEHVPTAH